MREFGQDYLFRVSLEPGDSWSRDKLKPIYVVSANKKSARDYAEKTLKSTKIKSVTMLAEQVAGHMFNGNYKL